MNGRVIFLYLISLRHSAAFKSHSHCTNQTFYCCNICVNCDCEIIFLSQQHLFYSLLILPIMPLIKSHSCVSSYFDLKVLWCFTQQRISLFTLSESRWIWWMFLYECVSPFFPSLSIHNWAHFDFSSCFCSMVIMTLMSTSRASCPKRSCYRREWVWCWDGRRSMLIMLIMFAELCNEPVRLRRVSRRVLDVVKALGWKHLLACQ